jgi:hypothetical protein
MRSTLTLLTVLTVLAGTAGQTARAQDARSQQFGYYVPVIVTDNGVAPAYYSSQMEDEESDSPMVSSDCAAGCSCSACDAKAQRGCCGTCRCLRCTHDRLFSRTFGSVETLLWYNKGVALPPLVTSNEGAIPPQTDAGVFGLPTTSVLFGNEGIDNDEQTGVRVTFGRWIDDECNVAIIGKFYGVEGGTESFTATSAGNPVLGRPFFNTDPTVNSEDALLVAYPGVSSGSVSISAENDMIGCEVFGRSLVDYCDTYRIDLIGGYQFTRIDSDLTMSSVHSAGLATFSFHDLFDVENEYHAGTAGLQAEVYRGCLTFGAMGKVGIGNMRQVISIEGVNSVTAGGTVTTPGGLYAQPTNIGEYVDNQLVWSPEANLKVSCAVTQRLSLSVGYTFLYFTRVALAGDQIDRNVNATQLSGGAIVGPAQPVFLSRDRAFWIQTIDFGVSFNY